MKTEVAKDELVRLIRERAENLYESRQMLCTEAVFVAMNEGLGGGLDERTALSIAAAFPEGLGGGGCMCGALAGAVLSAGLFLGQDRSSRRKDIREASRKLHGEFKTEFRSTCCRVLIRDVRDRPGEHFAQCTGLTGAAAEMAARLVLGQRPELARQADAGYLARRDSLVGGLFRRAARFFMPGCVHGQKA